MFDFVDAAETFATQKLGYSFNNVFLLTEALTYSTDTPSGGTEKNRGFEKLKVLGDAVLKLVSSEYAIQNNGILGERFLTEERKYLINKNTVRDVAQNLFGIINRNNKDYGLLKISEATWNDPSYDAQFVPYHKFLKAVFGAVFLDAGGTSGTGIESCMNIFLKLWACMVLGINQEVTELEIHFPVHRKIREHWNKMGMDHTYVKGVEICLGVEFENFDLICEALIQETFYDLAVAEDKKVLSNLYKPNYQRLEFLGDAVLGLIITELMFKKHPEDDISELTKHQICSTRLMEIADQLKLSRFVTLGKNAKFSKYDAILEAIIGAIYVDSGDEIVREFILREWKLVPAETFYVPESLSIPSGGPWKTLECRQMLSSKAVTVSGMGAWLEQKEKEQENIRAQRKKGIEIWDEVIIPVWESIKWGCSTALDIVSFLLTLFLLIFLGSVVVGVFKSETK